MTINTHLYIPFMASFQFYICNIIILYVIHDSSDDSNANRQFTQRYGERGYVIETVFSVLSLPASLLCNPNAPIFDCTFSCFHTALMVSQLSFYLHGKCSFFILFIYFKKVFKEAIFLRRCYFLLLLLF